MAWTPALSSSMASVIGRRVFTTMTVEGDSRNIFSATGPMDGPPMLLLAVAPRITMSYCSASSKMACATSFVVIERRFDFGDLAQDVLQPFERSVVFRAGQSQVQHVQLGWLQAHAQPEAPVLHTARRALRSMPFPICRGSVPCRMATSQSELERISATETQHEISFPIVPFDDQEIGFLEGNDVLEIFPGRFGYDHGGFKTCGGIAKREQPLSRSTGPPAHLR